jgi:hypothetical protein
MEGIIAYDTVAFKDATTLTIASGVVTATQTAHIIAAETGTTDNLDTITISADHLSGGGVTYRPLLLLRADTGDTITLKHGSGNLDFTGSKDITLTDGAWILFFYNGTNLQNVGGVAQTAAYTPTNVTPDRSYDADTVVVAELADVVGTLIADLQAAGLIG